MSTFTAVDLSRLEAPAVIETFDFETIVGEMLAQLRTFDPEFSAITEADPAYKILQVCAYRELMQRQRVNDAARAVMLAFATGSDLDHLAALLGVARLTLDSGDPDKGIPPTMENDGDFRRRVQLAPEGFSVAGPAGAYAYHALGADPRVLDARAESPAPGDVLVHVLSREGDGRASQELIAAVEVALSAEHVRPLTDRVEVRSAEVITYAVDATVFTYGGPDADVVKAAAQARLEAYVREKQRLGRSVTLSGLYSAIHVEGVQRVDLASPVEDVVAGPAAAPYCDAITIAHGGTGE